MGGGQQQQQCIAVCSKTSCEVYDRTARAKLLDLILDIWRPKPIKPNCEVKVTYSHHVRIRAFYAGISQRVQVFISHVVINRFFLLGSSTEQNRTAPFFCPAFRPLVPRSTPPPPTTHGYEHQRIHPMHPYHTVRSSALVRNDKAKPKITKKKQSKPIVRAMSKLVSLVLARHLFL